MLSVFDHGPPPPCPTPFNMAAHVLAGADAHPEKLALAVLHPDRRDDWSYARVKGAVLGLASSFLNLGLAPGDRVLLRLGNTPDYPLAYLAAIACDLVPVPTSAQLTQSETAKIIAEIAPALILHDPQVACPDDPRRCDVSAVRAMMDRPPAGFAMGDPERPAYIVYTSGTSGRPRGVVHAHRAIWARRMMLVDWYDLKPDDRLLHAGAFNWTYTMGTGLMDPWSIGATALIPAPGTDPARLPELLRRHEATIFAAAPGVYRKFLQPGETLDLPRLRHGLSAGEKLGPTIREIWEDATGRAVHEAYGMSECSTFISASPGHPAIGNATGRPQTGRRVAIIGANDAPVPRDTPGTIAVHRSDPGLMLGYLDAPEETKARFAADWFLTGDQGVMDTDDQITYLGRDDDMMNAGGYRVSPLEVEAALADAPGIDTLAVTEVEVKPDVRVIMAFYTAQDAIDLAQLDRFARERLAGYKRPRDYIHVPELPTGPNGKLSRKALTAYWRPA
jgi:acyl-coenzyme A synthetase/AMP-(fatty) acid ligase